jgi:cyclomaltodextrinase
MLRLVNVERFPNPRFKYYATLALLMAFATISFAQQESFVPRWVKDAVFYQIFPERFANGDSSNDPPGTEPWGGVPKPRNYFGGDLQGIIDHLDYISSLGVNALYLNPIFESNSNHKYTATDYMKIDPHFGDERTFKTLVDECHRRGIRIILDGVFNHTGVDFFAFKDIKEKEAKSKYIGWYNVKSFPVGPTSKPNYECWWGYGDLPKLMTQNPEVRQYLFEVTRHWMSFGIDGWRLDVPNEIPHDFWVEWRRLVKSINPDAYVVGELWNDASLWLKGDQFDGVMNYRFRTASLDFFLNGKLSAMQFDSALAKQRSDYPAEVNYVLQNLLGSHDTERLLTLCNGNTEAMMLAWLFQMTYVGAPMVYYGDEIGMMGGKDPGCRGTMVWEEKKQDTQLLDCIKGLINLRRDHQMFRWGTYETLIADTNVYAFLRRDKTGSGVVVLNNSKKSQTVTVPLRGQDTPTKWRQVWPRRNDGVKEESNLHTIIIPAKSGSVFIGGK